MQVADTGALGGDGDPGVTMVAPGSTPRVLDEPVFKVQVVIVTEADNGYGAIERSL